MRILVIGSGGREHALTWTLRQCRGVEQIYVAPGNGGPGAPGLDGDDPAETLIAGSGPQSRFAEAGVTGDQDAPGIQLRYLQKLVQNPGRSPGPQRNLSAAVQATLAIRIKKLCQTVGEVSVI